MKMSATCDVNTRYNIVLITFYEATDSFCRTHAHSLRCVPTPENMLFYLHFIIVYYHYYCTHFMC